jgi:hypothetical protein
MAGRNGSGVFTVTNPDFVSGTTISSSQMDANFADVATAITQSIAVDGQTTITANLPMAGFKFTGLAAGSTAGDSVRYEQLDTTTGVKGADIASAEPLVIGTDGNYFDVTGTATIATHTVAANRHYFTQFDGILTLTHNGTTQDLPGQADITTAAGDVAEWQSTGANTVQCVNYTRADGTAISGISASSTTTFTNKTFDAAGTGNSLSNVGVADLANGTDGELITWDAAGAPATVAAGTAAQVLTSNGAGAAPTFQTPAAGGAWNLIGTAVAATDATLTITGLDSTYDTYAIVISDMVPSTTTGVNFHINVGDSGGVDTGASDYAYHQSSFDTSAATYYGFNSTGDSKLSITGGNSIGGTAGKGIGGVLFLHRPGDGTTFPSLSGQGFFSAYTTKLYGWSLYGQRVAVITLDRVQVSFSGGNISTGRLSVFGISHA